MEKEKEIKFVFYVLNYDFSARKIENFNIFRNIHVNDYALRYVKKHLRNKKKYPFEQFVKDLDQTIQWQEWGRREYEISVGDAFETDLSKYKKIDCYFQVKPNMEMIAREVIYQYKAWLKNQK